jgi:hypothetical protein
MEWSLVVTVAGGQQTDRLCPPNDVTLAFSECDHVIARTRFDPRCIFFQIMAMRSALPASELGRLETPA